MIDACPLPDDAMLRDYSARGYTDCFVTEIDGSVSLEEFVAAFYTTPVFRIERFILSRFVSRPSSDEDVANLANGSGNEFAAWGVERRAGNQLLLTDFRGHTRSWLMTVPGSDQEDSGTRLYFGSAVVARQTDEAGTRTIGTRYRVLLGFHRLYSRILLRAARSRLMAGNNAG